VPLYCRGSEKPGDGVSRTASATGETTITSSSSSSLTSTTADDTVTLTLAQLPRRTHSVQDRHGQTVYIPSTDPVRVDLSGGSVTMTPGATADAPTPTAGAMSVSAPPGVCSVLIFSNVMGVGRGDGGQLRSL